MRTFYFHLDVKTLPVFYFGSKISWATDGRLHDAFPAKVEVRQYVNISASLLLND